MVTVTGGASNRRGAVSVDALPGHVYVVDIDRPMETAQTAAVDIASDSDYGKVKAGKALKNHLDKYFEGKRAAAEEQLGEDGVPTGAWQ